MFVIGLNNQLLRPFQRSANSIKYIKKLFNCLPRLYMILITHCNALKNVNPRIKITAHIHVYLSLFFNPQQQLMNSILRKTIGYI